MNNRNNYASVVASLDATIATTRQKIVDNILSKHDVVNSKQAISQQAAADVNNILLSKSCSETTISGFLDQRITHIKNGVQTEIDEIVNSYQDLIMNGYVPFFMIDRVINEFTNCAWPTSDVDAYDCLIRVSKVSFYLIRFNRFNFTERTTLFRFYHEFDSR